MRLVEKKFLKVDKKKPPIDFRPIVGGIVCFLVLYFIWSKIEFKITDNPDLSSLPSNIRNNEFFSQFQKKELIVPQVFIPEAYNEDNMKIQTKQFV